MAVRPVALKNPLATPESEQSQLFDTHPEVRLDFKHVRKSLKQGYTRPLLLVDTGIVRTKVRRFKAAMPRVHCPAPNGRAMVPRTAGCNGSPTSTAVTRVEPPI